MRFRDSGDMHVAMRSPTPASPAKVSGCAPAATPRRVISARPRVMIPALAESPKPSPSTVPAASATTFFSAPASSTPIRSGFVYTRNRSDDRTDASSAASSPSSDATTDPAGLPAAISRARFGPDSAATRRPGSSCATTSLMRRCVPSSMPFTTLSSGRIGEEHRSEPPQRAAQVCRWRGEPRRSGVARRGRRHRSRRGGWAGRRRRGGTARSCARAPASPPSRSSGSRG